MLSRSEEDHIKAIHALVQDGGKAGTKDLAEKLGIKASSVTVMVQRLAEKGLAKHEPYYGVELTAKGKAEALKLVRKHRLWETFLVEHLRFGWDQVHELAEQLEHVRSAELTDRLAQFLGDPDFDPHGDPIPDRQGRLPDRRTEVLLDCLPGTHVRLAAVKDGTDGLYQLLDRKGIAIGQSFTVAGSQPFDGSMELSGKDGQRISLSAKVAAHLLVEVTGPKGRKG
ncbi:MAG: metal-dependent transcriptional regulator [Flavobacteriales bacterium]|nr:metal-dependent transcriptional regulator [Flavobacteriales bacterium]MEB2341921.1 metal-dependent transcriptional regulator [Flavobacteriia bacterium]